MPGSNCKIYGCSVSRKAKYKDISIFRVPKVDDPYHNTWREKFVSVVTRDRVIDENLRRQIKNKNIEVCELHFRPEEIIHHASRKTLVPGTIPSQNLPKKSHETKTSKESKDGRLSSLAVAEKKQANNEAFAFDSGVLTKCYKSFKEMCARCMNLKLPCEWSSEIKDHFILLKRKDSMMEINKFEIYIDPTLCFTVRVYAWEIPENHLLYQKYERSMCNVTISNLVAYLESSVLCSGIDDQISTLSSAFLKHNIPKKHDYSVVVKGPLDQVEYSRSPLCLMILLPELDPKNPCSSCIKLTKTEHRSFRQKAKQLATPASLKAPISLTSPSRIKITLQQERAKNKELQYQLIEMKKELEENSLPVTKELESDIVTIMSSVEKDSVSPFMKLFWDEQQNYLKTSSKGVRYHPMVIRYCLSLAAKSPAVYDDIRHDKAKGTGVLILPSRRRLRDYKNYIRPQCGFNAEIIKELINKTKDFSDAERYFVFALDEMKIQEDLVWDKHTGDLIGFVDLGDTELNCGAFQGKVKTIASHVLVFLLRSVVNPIKFSFANFATTGASAFQLFPLVWKAISILELKCNLKVISVTCDGASANRRFFKLHQHLKDEAEEVTYKVANHFTEEKRFIYFIADPPHLMKTARNCLMNSGSGRRSRFMWNDGQHILWSHICDLYNEDQECGLHLLPKLTEDHIHLNSFSVMNVKLAVQVLSSTVAQVLENFGTKESAGTAKFCGMLDQFFDCTNVRNTKEGDRKLKPFLQPYNSCDDPRFYWLKEQFLEYFKKWKNSIDQRPGSFLESERAKMFISWQTYEGLQISCHSLIECIQFLLQNGVQYVLTERFCQDSLENYFGHQRSLGHRKDNPTLRDFGYNDNTIRNQKVVHPIAGGNVHESVEMSIDAIPLPSRKKKKSDNEKFMNTLH